MRAREGCQTTKLDRYLTHKEGSEVIREAPAKTLRRHDLYARAISAPAGPGSSQVWREEPELDMSASVALFDSAKTDPKKIYIYSTGYVAKKLHVVDRTIRRYLHLGYIPDSTFHMPGKKQARRYSAEQVDVIMDAMRHDPTRGLLFAEYIREHWVQ